MFIYIFDLKNNIQVAILNTFIYINFFFYNNNKLYYFLKVEV
jgi:hypothetical protein